MEEIGDLGVVLPVFRNRMNYRMNRGGGDAPNTPRDTAYAMELRLHVARTTKDIDLSWRGKLKAGSKKEVAAILREKLQDVASIDVGVGDAILNPLEEINARDWLDFAGIPVCIFPSIRREQQFAGRRRVQHAGARPGGYGSPDPYEDRPCDDARCMWPGCLPNMIL